MRYPTGFAVAVLWIVIGAGPATAVTQPSESSQPAVIKQLSIEELLELDVTLPLRREERVMDAPAAITILTAEDLRRHGAVSLPEALRYAPGLYVGRVSASSWIVASRGFASTSANKMLVMIDGRSVYSPLFSGVFWDQQDAVLIDLDRIETIRGPGAALWGSNAVNGVINVVSKSAAHTQGTLVSVGGGAEEQFFSSVRHGGRLAAGHYRVYGKFFQRDAANLEGDVDAGDGQRLGQGGFRVDLERATHSYTLQGDVYRTTQDPTPTGAQIAAAGMNVLGRWTRRPHAGSELQLQAYIDRTQRFVPAQIDEERTTIDLDAQQRWHVADRHTFSAGASYRYSSDQTIPSPRLEFGPADRATSLLGAFAQDEIRLSRTLSTILGLKVERNDYTGIEWQPQGRVRWTINSANTIWSAVSRAVRLPTRIDTDVRVFEGPVVVAAGNPDFRSESLVAYELGYRVAPARFFAVDLTTFIHRYNDLRSQEHAGTGVFIGNKLNDVTHGGNITASVQPRPWVRVTGAYTRLGHDLSLDPGSTDVYGGRFETVDPKNMGRLLGRFDLPAGVELDVMTTFVGQLPQIVAQAPGTPGYTEASIRVGWRARPNADISVVARDILNRDHVEFISPTSTRVTRLERALFTRVTLSF